jgi:sirohydrochlorin ferrochelatase
MPGTVKSPAEEDSMSEERKPAIILLGHGSRVQQASDDMEKIATALRDQYGYLRVACCFMSRLGPHVPETLHSLIAAGETTILVIPYFLHSGVHLRLDIPELLQREAQKYPGVRIQLGAHLGYDDLLVSLVHRRILASLKGVDVREIVLPPRSDFPVPPGQHEFVPMSPEEARRYAAERGLNR